VGSEPKSGIFPGIRFGLFTYQVLSTGQAYQEKQAPVSDPRHTQRMIRHHIRRLGKLGVRVYGQYSSSSATATSPTTGK
jgi:hypothetical protein